MLAAGTYLFESIQKKNDILKNYLSIANSLTTKLINFISVANLNEESAKIRKKQLLKHLRYQKISDINDVAIVNFNYINVFMNKQIEEKIESKKFFIIDSKSIKAVADSNINEHWKKKYRKKINETFKKHKILFKSELERFTNDIKIFIFFKNEKNILKLKQISYSMSIKNKKAMNEILNPLVKNDKIQKISLKTISSAASPAFVVWKNEKSRIVIDLKWINTRLYSDAYSLFKQNTILFFLGDLEVFSFINLIKRFFQQNTKSRDWWKITFATFHRELKWLIVSNMNLGNIFEFFQNRMKKIFDFYLWKFVLIYMNDIIVFSLNTKKHLTHLNEILNFLKKSEVILAFKKCHFAYSSIKTLNHYVFRLGMSILEKKIKTIKKLKFFKTLHELKTAIEFFDYYRKFVTWYAWKKKFLLKLKILNFKNSFVKKNSRLRWANRIRIKDSSSSKKSITVSIKNERILNSDEKCFQIWKNLKKILITTFTLNFFDFFRSFILYVNESKKKKFEVILHQINKNGIKKSILFLFKSLTSAEENYWSIKSKTATLIWALTKLLQYFDSESFTVVTDHFALKTALQTKITNRRSAKLNEWIMFLFTFLFRMEIRHRSEKTHQNADDLSRLSSRSKKKKIVKIMFMKIKKQSKNDFASVKTDQIQKSKIDSFQFEINQNSERNSDLKKKKNFENSEKKENFESEKNFIVIIADQNDLLIKIVFELSNDSSFEKIMTKLKNQIETIKNENDDFQKKFQYYRLNTNTNLFYLKNKFESNRLCISQKSQKRLLKYAHDEHAHGGVHRTYDLLLKSVYMPKMKKTVIEYVTTCSTCQLFKSFRQLSYEQLQLIFFSKKFLFELSLDFIVALSMTFNENNAILTMTDRFSKYVKLISDKKTLSTEKWKTFYWKFIFKDWNIFTKLISDRNFKFNSDF